MLASISTNLSILGFFKYFNFFAQSTADLLEAVRLDVSPAELEVQLPLGISFYTFQSMSYAIDVYRRRIPASREFVPFALYVAFFPQLVAGPIERRNHSPSHGRRCGTPRTSSTTPSRPTRRGRAI